MSGLITNLVEFAKVESSDPRFISSDVNEVVSNKMLELHRQISNRNAAIDMHLMPQELVCIPDQIGVLFYNLINNAIQFNNSHQPRVVVNRQERKRDWLFSIRDNGVGIDAEKADSLFNLVPSVVSGEDSNSSAGTGLSICKRIVSMHKGDMWFESEKDKGTTFYFTISKDIKGSEYKPYNPFMR